MTAPSDMKRGCFIGLLTWAVCAYGYWYFIHARLQAPLDWIVPVAAGLIMAVVIRTLRIAIAAGRDAIRLSQQAGASGTLGEKPRDGEIVTVPGRIRASGSPMHAPISGRSAVLYSYEISHTARGQDDVRSVKDYSGFGLTPTVVDSP